MHIRDLLPTPLEAVSQGPTGLDLLFLIEPRPTRRDRISYVTQRVRERKGPTLFISFSASGAQQRLNCRSLESQRCIKKKKRKSEMLRDAENSWDVGGPQRGDPCDCVGGRGSDRPPWAAICPPVAERNGYTVIFIPWHATRPQRSPRHWIFLCSNGKMLVEY